MSGQQFGMSAVAAEVIGDAAVSAAGDFVKNESERLAKDVRDDWDDYVEVGDHPRNSMGGGKKVPARAQSAPAAKKKQSKQLPVRPAATRATVPAPGSAVSRVLVAPTATNLSTTMGTVSVTGNKWTGDGSIRVRRREYIQDIVSIGQAFNVQSFPVNPGLGYLHWLRRLAQEYDQYVVNSITFIYETDQSTSTAGTVMMAFDYDAADAAVQNKQDLRDFVGAVKGPTWASMRCVANPKIAHANAKSKYIRSSYLLDPNQDIKTFDFATFYIATSNQAGSSTVGELSVEYDITLLAPHFSANEISYAASAHYIGTASGATSTFNSMVATGPAHMGVRFLTTRFLPSDSGLYFVVHRLTGTGLTSYSVNPTAPEIGTAGSVTTLINATGTELWAYYTINSLIGPGNNTISNGYMPTVLAASWAVSEIYITRGGF